MVIIQEKSYNFFNGMVITMENESGNLGLITSFRRHEFYTLAGKNFSKLSPKRPESSYFIEELS